MRGYDIEEVYKRAISILNKKNNIIFDSLLYGSLGISETWFYDTLMKDEAKKKSIRQLINQNRAKNATKKYDELDRQKDTTAIITILKLNSIDARHALNTTREEIVHIPQDENSTREELFRKLSELS